MSEKKIIYMEPEEYEAYLKEQEEMIAAFQEKSKEMAEQAKDGLASTTLYEINQGIMNGMSALDEDGKLKARQKFFEWFWGNDDANNIDHYYMLLCKELNYYTIFHNSQHCAGATEDPMDEDDLWRELLDVLSYVGDIKVMEVDTNGAWSIWADWHGEGCHCFYFFPYGGGVVEV